MAVNRFPITDPDLVEFRDPFSALRTVATSAILTGCGFLMYLFFMKLSALPRPDYSGWFLFAFSAMVLTFAGVMSFQRERLVIDRRSKRLHFWKAGKIPFAVETHPLDTLIGCVITQQERSDDDSTYTMYSVRLIFSQSTAAVLETQNKLKAVVFAREIRRELFLVGDAEIVVQMSDHDALLRWLKSEDRAQK